MLYRVYQWVHAKTRLVLVLSRPLSRHVRRAPLRSLAAAFTASTFAIDRSFVPRRVVVCRPRAGPRNPPARGWNKRQTRAWTRDRGDGEGTVPSSRDDGDDDDDARCTNDTVAIAERSSRLARASIPSFLHSLRATRVTDRPVAAKTRSTPSRRSVLRRSRASVARVVPPDLDVDSRRRASLAPHRPRRPSRLARIAVGTLESSPAPLSFFFFCIFWRRPLGVFSRRRRRRARGRAKARVVVDVVVVVVVVLIVAVAIAIARSSVVARASTPRRRRGTSSSPRGGGLCLRSWLRRTCVEVIRGTRSLRRRDVGSSRRARRRM